MVNCLQYHFLIASDNLKIANIFKNIIVRAYKGFKIVSGYLNGTVRPYAAAVDDSEQIPFDCEVFPRHLFIEQVTRLTRSYFSLIALKFCNRHIYSIYNFLFLLIVLKMFPTYLSVDLPARQVASKQKDFNCSILYCAVASRLTLPYLPSMATPSLFRKQRTKRWILALFFPRNRDVPGNEFVTSRLRFHKAFLKKRD